VSRGRLRIYLGAAPGVGKTYAMLNEGRRRRDRGADVVIGFVDPHGRSRTADQIADLEVVPRARIEHRGSMFEEMDLDAVLRRNPQIALVDELAHTNVPGSRNEKRWRDVQELLGAGIDVVSTLNVQHLESLNDVVESITGVHQRETIPDDVVRSAEQVELVDMTPEALRRRMVHGNIYVPEKVDAALANYFRPGNLGALRELALLWVADRVDETLLRYRDEHGIDDHWETRERVVVALTGAPSGAQLVRRAARMAHRAHGDLLGVHVQSSDGRAEAPSGLLDEHRQLLQDLGGEYHEVVASDVVEALVRFARDHNATQLVLGASGRGRWAKLTRGSVINRVIGQSGDIDIHVISTGPPAGDQRGEQPHRPRSTPLTSRQRALAWVIAVAGTLLMTVLLAATRSTFEQGSRFLLYQTVVVLTALVGGTAPAVTAALLSSAALNWYFTPPLYTLAIEDPESVLALVMFLTLALLIGLLVTTLARRTADARRGRAEVEALARVASGLAAGDDPIPPMLDRIRTTLGIEGIAVFVGPTAERLAVSGRPPGPDADTVIALPDGVLAVRGVVSPDDRQVLEAFTAQVATAVERRRLRAEAERATALAAADKLRTALLRAVSHDLRTPLASIKAAVTSLLQRDVEWSADEEREFLTAIDVETDRLNTVVGNLLDAGRLEAGAITPASRPVALDDIVPAALASISGLETPIEIAVPPTLPQVRADPGLLERAIANVVANAARATPEGSCVQIAANRLGNDLQLRVIDHGAGVPADQRDRIFEPFQRLGDTPAGEGVGLGLSVARGVLHAMGGSLTAEDTPGGGFTAVITLPAHDDG
jgi:two-component system sensor histidine kinase KdpD